MSGQGRPPAQRTAAVVLLLALAAGCSGPAGAPPAGPPPAPAPTSAPTPPIVAGLPGSMAALGDSITQAFLVCGISDCPQDSWSTGSAGGLGSHSQRLGKARGAAVDTHNLAVSGARVSDLAAQARVAVAAKVDYVTVLIGANDACAPSEESMTSLAKYTAAYDLALATLAGGLPKAKILAVSIPDLEQLWRVGKDRAEVRSRWERFWICQSMLGDAASTSAAAAARRQRVRERVIAYNRAMAAVCARHPNCRWEGGAVFGHPFALDMVSAGDYWHPSLAGQRMLAEVTWRAGYWPQV